MKYVANILIAGAGFAGLATAYWMRQLGYRVTVVEIAAGLKMGGTPVNIRNDTLRIVRRMGLYGALQANRLYMEPTQIKRADGVTVAPESGQDDAAEQDETNIEVERDVLLGMLFDAAKED